MARTATAGGASHRKPRANSPAALGTVKGGRKAANRLLDAVKHELDADEVRTAAEQADTFQVEVIRGVHMAPCLSVNGTRVSGPKPWGGGTVEQAFTVKRADIITAAMGNHLVPERVNPPHWIPSSRTGLCSVCRTRVSIVQAGQSQSLSPTRMVLSAHNDETMVVSPVCHGSGSSVWTEER